MAGGWRTILHKFVHKNGAARILPHGAGRNAARRVAQRALRLSEAPALSMRERRIDSLQRQHAVAVVRDGGGGLCVGRARENDVSHRQHGGRELAAAAVLAAQRGCHVEQRLIAALSRLPAAMEVGAA